MTRFVIGPDVAVHLVRERTGIHGDHRLVAPTLLRSQVLSLLYQEVRRGELTTKDAQRRLDLLRGLKIRLLGDRVLQSAAWQLAEQFGWTDTYTAEYVALTRLQADAFVTLDEQLRDAVRDTVPVATIDALTAESAGS